MKQVWKCDYCRDTNKSKTIIAEHEKECSFNPDVNDCFTCARHTRVPYDDLLWKCELGWVMYVDHQAPCPEWKLNPKLNNKR